MAKDKEQKSANQFEADLQALETLVADLEKGDLSLEDSLKTFEHGVKLTRQCQEALHAAEQKVSLLTEKGGELTPFESQD